jgi:hypothetical protein
MKNSIMANRKVEVLIVTLDRANQMMDEYVASSQKMFVNDHGYANSLKNPQDRASILSTDGVETVLPDGSLMYRREYSYLVKRA